MKGTTPSLIHLATQRDCIPKGRLLRKETVLYKGKTVLHKETVLHKDTLHAAYAKDKQTHHSREDSLNISKSYTSPLPPTPTSKYAPSSSLNRCSTPSGTASFSAGSFACELFFFRRPFFFVSLFFSSLYHSPRTSAATSSQCASW